MRKINGKRSEKMDRRRRDRWRESFSRIEFCSQGSRKEFDPKMERTLFEEGRNFVRRRSKKSKKKISRQNHRNKEKKIRFKYPRGMKEKERRKRKK